jgi:hypothetical protein
VAVGKGDGSGVVFESGTGKAEQLANMTLIIKKPSR